jgi:cation diffusion facilitator CzcD-associated flavoprotein CzcO
MFVETSTTTPSPTTDHVDVLIVGAGISGIGAAYHLRTKQPHRSFAILDGRDAIGGTWDLFRYPGIRSDSDLQTFGYAFKPWTNERAIADAGSILAYLRETASENDIERHIRFGHKVTAAAWSSDEGRWTVTATRTDTGEVVTVTAGWLFCAGGYYNTEEGYTPDFPGRERFAGQIVHPQHWPEDLDYTGKKVVVIGSGATAVTLIPAMSDKAAHVTMLQRSPTYVMSLPAKDAIANALRRVLGDARGYALARRKNIWIQRAIYRVSRNHPKLVRRFLRAATKRQLPADFDVDTHFNPSYDPWDQRLCAVPDGDLFKAISAGDASVVTDRIATFTETGILLESGATLDADLIVTATGLNLRAFGGIAFTVDGTDVSVADTVAYKAAMVSDVPNFTFALGYTNSSWTLKVDLVCEYLCRLLAHMDANGYDQCVPESGAVPLSTRPMWDIAAGYVQRGGAVFPKKGTTGPWQVNMDYRHDIVTLRENEIEDGVLRFARIGQATPVWHLELAAV